MLRFHREGARVHYPGLNVYPWGHPRNVGFILRYRFSKMLWVRYDKVSRRLIIKRIAFRVAVNEI